MAGRDEAPKSATRLIKKSGEGARIHVYLLVFASFGTFSRQQIVFSV
jgi:hypothetical protein